MICTSISSPYIIQCRSLISSANIYTYVSARPGWLDANQGKEDIEDIEDISEFGDEEMQTPTQKQRQETRAASAPTSTLRSMFMSSQKFASTPAAQAPVSSAAKTPQTQTTSLRNMFASAAFTAPAHDTSLRKTAANNTALSQQSQSFSNKKRRKNTNNNMPAASGKLAVAPSSQLSMSQSQPYASSQDTAMMRSSSKQHTHGTDGNDTKVEDFEDVEDFSDNETVRAVPMPLKQRELMAAPPPRTHHRDRGDNNNKRIQSPRRHAFSHSDTQHTQAPDPHEDICEFDPQPWPADEQSRNDDQHVHSNSSAQTSAHAAGSNMRDVTTAATNNNIGSSSSQAHAPQDNTNNSSSTSHDHATTGEGGVSMHRKTSWLVRMRSSAQALPANAHASFEAPVRRKRPTGRLDALLCSVLDRLEHDKGKFRIAAETYAGVYLCLQSEYLCVRMCVCSVCTQVHIYKPEERKFRMAAEMYTHTHTHSLCDRFKIRIFVCTFLGWGRLFMRK